MAFVVLRRDADVPVLADHCRLALAAFKQPQAIRILLALPRNATGKVIKSALISSGD
jgi:acyl-CoA synthetase (AMP-forming)/AMP-acid ligase II